MSNLSKTSVTSPTSSDVCYALCTGPSNKKHLCVAVNSKGLIAVTVYSIRQDWLFILTLNSAHRKQKWHRPFWRLRMYVYVVCACDGQIGQVRGQDCIHVCARSCVRMPVFVHQRVCVVSKAARWRINIYHLCCSPLLRRFQRVLSALEFSHGLF